MRALGVLTGLRAEARIATPLGMVVAGGGARQGARDARFPGCTALLSFGLAGGLDPALPPGALIVPESVIADGQRVQCDPDLLAWLGGPTVHAVTDAAGIIATVAAKQRLYRSTGASAIDLESGEVARRGLPFAVVRAICDPATEDLPPAALAGLSATGAIDMQAVLMSLLCHPSQFPAIIRLAGHTAAARRTLISVVRTVSGR